MHEDQRRSRRIIDYLPIEVHAADSRSGRCIAGPFAGRIIDISLHGACLLMTQVLRNSFHIFHSTRENNSLLLQLTTDYLPELDQCMFTAIPIWIDLFQRQQIKAFKMGVEFTGNPDGDRMRQLQLTLHKHQEERGQWWLDHSRIG
ncbi:PilZ domain-containing protein [Desulfobulbus alkaliphilus]|uniref:PilZ domain-containing protein n=1 Tax=Desulfobulbus alkaliphilus TaxID=869814 RepID=UPI00196411EE|nr:PilZ domain-containing protein [Desulfobulbus alkaliphilus]MBM9537980.1 PilZ domain-containing protein [Desulfobulbus alkaliphilus]